MNDVWMRYCIACTALIDGQSFWLGEAGPYCAGCYAAQPLGSFTRAAFEDLPTSSISMTQRSPEGPAPQPDFQKARSAVIRLSDAAWNYADLSDDPLRVQATVNDKATVNATLTDAEAEIARLTTALRWALDEVPESRPIGSPRWFAELRRRAGMEGV